MAEATGKTALRRTMRPTRAALVSARGSSAIDPPADFADLLRGVRTVAGYVATGSEADPAPLLAAARRSGLTIALPHTVSREEPIRFLVDDGTPLIAGPFGLIQPPHDAPEAAPDLVLVPLLAFDAALHRLGQGAGHYDRALHGLRKALRIGVAFLGQRVDALPVDSWDQPLDAVITEAGIVWREGTKS
jgi:5-formyltetrahydrofolate cyclo-ligase